MDPIEAVSALAAAEAKEADKKEEETRTSQEPVSSMAAVFERLTTLIEMQSENARELTASPEAVLTSGKGPETRAPDRFDGANPSKLRPFLTQCRLVFLNHTKRFATDRSKVLYAGSYLSGVAADWFEPFTQEDAKEAIVLDDWQLFQERIERIFGDSNAVATAEHNLDTLYMRDNQKINDYITRFRTYSAKLEWDDNPLKYAFRKGLANRILDELARVDTPDTLSDLIELSLKIDNRHWERERERKLHPRAANIHTASSNSAPRREQRSTREPQRDSRSPRPTDRPQRTFDRPKKDLDRVLNQDGKLNASEKARRAERGLCNYCGGPHKIDDCPVRPKSNTPGRRARTSTSAQVAEAPTSQAKN